MTTSRSDKGKDTRYDYLGQLCLGCGYYKEDKDPSSGWGMCRKSNWNGGEKINEYDSACPDFMPGGEFFRCEQCNTIIIYEWGDEKNHLYAMEEGWSRCADSELWLCWDCANKNIEAEKGDNP